MSGEGHRPVLSVELASRAIRSSWEDVLLGLVSPASRSWSVGPPRPALDDQGEFARGGAATLLSALPSEPVRPGVVQGRQCALRSRRLTLPLGFGGYPSSAVMTGRDEHRVDTQLPSAAVAPAYHALGYASASPEIWVRVGLSEALQRAAASLPDGMSILIWDGLRTLDLQREIAERFESELADLPISVHDRTAILKKYVAPIPESEDEYRAAPAAHTTGGTVNVTLCNAQGRPLDLGISVRSIR